MVVIIIIIHSSIFHDLTLFYQILNGYCDITIASCLVNRSDDIARVNHYKLHKHSYTVDATKYYFTKRIANVCNSLPNCVVTAPNLTCVCHRLSKTDLSKFCAN